MQSPGLFFATFVSPALLSLFCTDHRGLPFVIRPLSIHPVQFCVARVALYTYSNIRTFALLTYHQHGFNGNLACTLTLPPPSLPRFLSIYFQVGVATYESGPSYHDYQKRAIYRPPPRRFEVDVLAPRNLASPIVSACRYTLFSTTSLSFLGVPILRTTYGELGTMCGFKNYWRTAMDMSREKRHRLQAGRGIKKNGVYIHDRAASFESLPPGPDPKSVATDIHHHLPKLTKRGTFFGATQATDLPSLIMELREDRAVRDFFGYWRRDHDLVAKRSGSRPKTAPESIRSGSFISSFFSTSSVSLSPPHASLPPISSRSASLSRRSHTTDSTLSLPYAESMLSDAPNPPSSAPAHLGSTPRDSATSGGDVQLSDGRSRLHLGFIRFVIDTFDTFDTLDTLDVINILDIFAEQSHPARRALSHRVKSSSSPQSETFNVTSDFPLFLSSSSRNLLPSRGPHSPSHVTPGLGTLQEDTVLDSSESNRPPPMHRSRQIAPVNTERANRNFVVWPETDEVSSSEGDVHELLTPVDGTNFNVAVASSTLSGSEHAWPSSMEIDLPDLTTDSFSQFEASLSSPTASSSSSTLRRSHRRRSLSQPLPVTSSIPTDVGEGDWFDHAEDSIDAYLSGPERLFVKNEVDPIIGHYDEVRAISLSTSPTIRGRLNSRRRRTNSRTPSPWVTASRSRSPPPSTHLSRAMSITSSIAMDDTLVVKAAFGDVIVGLRAQRDMSLVELRQRVLEKFARTEGLSLRGAFELSYLPPAVGAGKRRASAVSLASTMSVDWSSALPLRNEDDWATAIASCGSKITLRVAYPTETPKTYNSARTRMVGNYV
ncbi:hypothetical protein BJV77DRAFT_965141 [Russula vinacea]|nr:hypothetical protein BJV77DRAFT_965141 [Russula vinacea]